MKVGNLKDAELMLICMHNYAHFVSGQQGCDLLWFSCDGVRILQLVVCLG